MGTTWQAISVMVRAGGDRAADVERLARTVELCLATAEALITERDQAGPGFISGTDSESSPPWNAAAALAVLIPHAELRRLEQQVRVMVTGHPAPLRGGSAGNTAAALGSLVAHASAVPEEVVSLMLAKMDRWVAFTLALPAVDRMAQWEPLPLEQRPWCPHGCGTTLRSHTKSKVIACIHPACAGATGDRRPWGRLVGRVIEWSDGTSQPVEVPGSA